MRLEDEREEVLLDEGRFGDRFSSECGNICYLAREAEDDAEFPFEAPRKSLNCCRGLSMVPVDSANTRGFSHRR